MGALPETPASTPWTIDEIGRLVSPVGDPAATLANVVELAASRFNAVAASLYILESERATLVLSAAIGVDPEGVGRMGVRVGEGPLGHAAEARLPHRAGGVLGAPIVYRGLLQGLIVVQRHDPAPFTADEEQVLVAGAAQMAPLVSNARADARRRFEWELVQRAKAEVLATLAPGLTHELNNKLMPITSWAELMLEDADQQQNEELQEGCATIRDSAFEAAHVLERLLHIATPAPVHASPCDLVAVVGAVVTQLQDAIAAASVHVSVNAPAAAPLNGDVAQLTEVCTQLVRNALEAMAASPVRELTLAIAPADRVVTLAVTDTGKGIDPERLPRVFDPYFTSKESRSRGIGLSLCLGIVRQHGGEMRIVSTVGGGTTMRVILPAPSVGAVAAADVAQPFARIEPMRVLVIDDDERMLQLVAAVLESKLGCRVERASNGMDARTALEHAEFDLVLSDIRMPHMDGVQLLDWITLNRPNVVPRTMFMTGDVQPKGPSADIERAGRPVLKKPFSLDTLVSAAKQVMTRPAPPQAHG